MKEPPSTWLINSASALVALSLLAAGGCNQIKHGSYETHRSKFPLVYEYKYHYGGSFVPDLTVYAPYTEMPIYQGPPRNFVDQDGALIPELPATTADLRTSLALQPRDVSTTPTFQRVAILDWHFIAVQIVDPNQASFVVGSIPLDSTPYSMAITPDGTRIVTPVPVLQGSVATAPYVGVLNVQQMNIADRIALPTHATPHWIAITPDGKYAYVTDDGYDLTPNAASVYVIDLTTNTIAKTITLPANWHLGHLVMDPEGSTLYAVQDSPSNGIVMIDTLTNTVAAQISFAVSPDSYLAITPTGTRLYAAGIQASNGVGTYVVTVIDTATASIIDNIALPNASMPHIGRMVVTLDGESLFVNEDNSGTLYGFSTKTDQLMGTIPTGIPDSYGRAAGALMIGQ